MTQIVEVGREGLTQFNIGRGTDEPTSTFNVEYFPCDGREDPNITTGKLMKLFLSDPEQTAGYEDIFTGKIDNVNETENSEGISYQITGRDLAAVLNYQKFTLYEGTGGDPDWSEKIKQGKNAILCSDCGCGPTINLNDEILKLMQNTPLTNLKIGLPEKGEMCFQAYDWYQYKTDAAEDNVSSFLNPLLDHRTSFNQGEWHYNRKYYNVVTPSKLTKAAALDQIISYINTNTSLGQYSWCVDNHGVLIIFCPEKPRNVIPLDIEYDFVSEISIGEDSTGVTNKIDGYGRNISVKTVEPASTTRVECHITNQDSIDLYDEREAETIDDPDVSYSDLEKRCKNGIAPQAKVHMTAKLENYSNISPATAIRILNRPRAADKIFTVTNYQITGQTGDYSTTLEGEVWSKTVQNPTPYQAIRAVAGNEVQKAYSIPCTVVGVDKSGAMVKVIPNSGGSYPSWHPYLRRTNNV